MQYMLLIYGDMSAYPEMTEEERAADSKRWFDYTRLAAEEGMDAGRRRARSTSTRRRASG